MAAYQWEGKAGRPVVIKVALARAGLTNIEETLINPPHTPALELEREFWNHLRTGETKNATYLAGVPHCLFPNQREDDEDISFNFNYLPSLLVPDEEIEGIHTPVVNVGAKNTAFAWHVEDYRLFSFNIHHGGEPKLWYLFCSFCSINLSKSQSIVKIV